MWIAIYGNMIRMTYSELFIAAPCVGAAILFLFERRSSDPFRPLFQGDSPHQRIIDILVFSLVMPLLPIILYIFEEITFFHLMGALLWYFLIQCWIMSLVFEEERYGEGTQIIFAFSLLVCCIGACLALLYMIVLSLGFSWIPYS